MISSFYSYKGGVGRSQLCANIAAYLCFKKGRKVLLWDWDFEAPGLHFFFEKSNADINRSGTIEMLEKYVGMMRTRETISENDYEYFPVDSIIALKEGELVKGNIGKIDLIPGGNYNDNFVFRVNNFNWYEFYELLDGKVFIEGLKKWIKSLDYDYVFIDSRTGINDYSGICNLQLPDINIVVMAANEQNISGCKKIIDQIRNAEYTKLGFRKPFIFPILSRINVNHPAYQFWSERFVDEFHDLLIDLDLSLKPYFSKEIFRDFYLDRVLLEDDPRFSAGENLLISDTKQVYPKGSFISKYVNISEYIENIKNSNSIGLDDQIDIETWRNYGEQSEGIDEKEKIAYAYEKAREIEKSIEFGGTFRAHLDKGTDFFFKGDYDQALKHYQKALDMKPYQYEALYNMGTAYYHKGDFDQAIAVYQKAIDIDSNKYEIWSNMGSTYYAKGDFDQAIAAYQKSVSINPDKDFAWYNMGIVYSAKDDFDQAIAAYQKAVGINPDKHEAWYNMGNAYGSKGDFNEAIAAYQKAIHINPGKYEAWSNMGNAYSKKDNFDQALLAYQKAIEIKPEEDQPWFYMGIAYSNKGDIGQAIAAYQKVIEINPEFAEAYVNLGFGLVQTGKLVEAEKILIKSVSLGATDMGNINLGHVYFGLNKMDLALECYKKSVSAFLDKDLFWDAMRADFRYLEQYGITRTQFDEILEIIAN